MCFLALFLSLYFFLVPSSYSTLNFTLVKSLDRRGFNRTTLTDYLKMKNFITIRNVCIRRAKRQYGNRILAGRMYIIPKETWYYRYLILQSCNREDYANRSWLRNSWSILFTFLFSSVIVRPWDIIGSKKVNNVRSGKYIVARCTNW